MGDVSSRNLQIPTKSPMGEECRTRESSFDLHLLTANYQLLTANSPHDLDLQHLPLLRLPYLGAVDDLAREEA